jgi:RNA polymerase sigma-70 factor (TIGR02943 family)
MEKDFLESLVYKHTKELYNWAFYKTSRAEIAEDLVQETFLAATEKLSSFKEQSSPKTWLFSILNNKIIDFYRKKINQDQSLDDKGLSAHFNEYLDWRVSKKPQSWKENEKHLLDDNEFQETLKKCLDLLPDKWNTCVKLKYLSEKNGEEICQEVGISTTNFWQIVHRAKLKLRDCIETNWLKN